MFSTKVEMCWASRGEKELEEGDLKKQHPRMYKLAKLGKQGQMRKKWHVRGVTKESVTKKLH